MKELNDLSLGMKLKKDSLNRPRKSQKEKAIERIFKLHEEKVIELMLTQEQG